MTPRAGLLPSSASIAYGLWGQNVGNAFFNLGGEFLLKQIFEHVYPIQDAPGYWTLHRKDKGSFRNWWSPHRYVNSEWMILQGPLLNPVTGYAWRDVLSEMRARGVSIGLLGAGLNSYTEEDRRFARQFVEEIRPAFISTRDEPTYDVLRGSSSELHCGIDSAFFLSDAVDPVPLETEYAVLNFDHRIEPRIRNASSNSGSGPTFWWGGTQYRLVESPLLGLTKRGQSFAYALAPLFRGGDAFLPESDVALVRTDHRTNPHMPLKIYARPNSIASDEPYTYASVYASALFTISDRVHACVASAGFGTPFLFMGNTPRAALLDRILRVERDDGFVQFNIADLADAKSHVIKFVRDVVSSRQS